MIAVDVPRMLICAFVAGLIILARAIRRPVPAETCRRCGFDLRGRSAESTCCSECGTPLSEALSRPVVVVRNRPRWIFAGILLVLPGLMLTGQWAWQRAPSVDLTRWTPTSWLIAESKASRIGAQHEVMRRLRDGQLDDTTVHSLVEDGLTVQTDRTKPWDVWWGNIIDEAIARRQIKPEQVERYLRQGLDVTLEAPRQARRGEGTVYRLRVGSERYGEDVVVDYQTSPITLGSVQIAEAPGFVSAGRSLFRAPVDEHRPLWFTDPRLQRLPLGEHDLMLALKATIAMVRPIPEAPLTIDMPISVPIEILADDAPIDPTLADAGLRTALNRAFPEARIVQPWGPDTDDLPPQVLLKVRSVPIPIIVEVVLVRGTEEVSLGLKWIDSEQLFLPNGWHVLSYAFENSVWATKGGGAIEMHLRPPKPGDVSGYDNPIPRGVRNERWHYTGEPIIISRVIVGEPPDAPFNRDEALRQPMAECVHRPQILVKDGKYEVSFNVQSPPVRLAFKVIVSDGRREVFAGRWSTDLGETGQMLPVDPSVFGVGERPRVLNIILRPDPNWELYATDAAPPWGGEIVFRDVTVDRSRSDGRSGQRGGHCWTRGGSCTLVRSFDIVCVKERCAHG